MEHESQVPSKPRKLNRHGKPIHEFLVRLDVDLYEQVRERAYREHSSMADVVRDALLRHL